jgi:hypothetical protein
VAVPNLVAALEAAQEAWKELFSAPDTDPAAAYVDHTVDYDRAFHSRLGIVDALGAIGPAAAKEARTLLESLVAAGDPLLAYHAARALRRM